MDNYNFTEQPKKQEVVARRKTVQEEEAGRGNSITDSVNSDLWVWTRLPNLYTA
jgi:hypothetical protein